MKFTVLVRGRARSPESLAAFLRAIEDQAYICHPGYPGLSYPGLTVEIVPSEVPAAPAAGPEEMRGCPKCGASWPARTFAGDWCPLCERKSARWGLNAFRDWVRREPLDVVVFGLLMFVCGFAACKLLKP